MDIQGYIASGILEGYVLGSLSDQERREVECMSKIYPELQQHLQELQHTIEDFAEAGAMTPPPTLKAKIMAEIARTEREDNTATNLSEAKIVRMQLGKTRRVWVAAASIGIILGMGAFLIYSVKQNTELSQQLSALEKQTDQRKQENQQLAAQIRQEQATRNLLASATTREIQLKGTDKQPDAQVKVFYNKEQGRAVLTLSNLSQPEADKQYQLWALVGGKPIDLGVFDYDSVARSGSLVEVSMGNIDAFAITLEKAGGSPVPTLEQLMAIGNI